MGHSSSLIEYEKLLALWVLVGTKLHSFALVQPQLENFETWSIVERTTALQAGQGYRDEYTIHLLKVISERFYHTRRSCNILAKNHFDLEVGKLLRSTETSESLKVSD